VRYATPALRLLPRGSSQVLINCRNNRKLLARVKVGPRRVGQITALRILLLAHILLRKRLHAQFGGVRCRGAVQCAFLS
jgi:hypothetical protein